MTIRTFLAIIFTCLSLAKAQDTAPTAPPTTAPATAPADTVKVKRGSLDLSASVAGAFVPIDPFEVRLRFKAYQGDLLIVSLVAPGSSVAKDDVVLQIDDVQFKRQLAGAQSEQTVAEANLVKAQSDVALGDAADALAMRIQEAEVKNAQDNLKWWEKVDGAQMLQDADLQIKYAKDSVDDQQDELDQLKKMYKSEQLTNATADIVVKRALRAMENAKVHLTMTEARSEKTKTNDFPIAHTRVQDVVPQQQQAMDQLKAQQNQSKVARQGALTAAQIALEAANERLANLKDDATQFTQRAPQGMTIYYGQLVSGSWQNNNPALLRAGEKIILPPPLPGTVPGAQMTGVATRVAGGKLKFVADVPEDKILLMHKDLSGSITPSALPQERVEATATSIAPAVGVSGNFEVAFALSHEIPGVLPGMKGSLKTAKMHIENILLVPVAAVGGDKVWVKQSDGSDKSVEVSTGRSDGESIEIVSGLKEGDEILSQAKK